MKTENPTHPPKMKNENHQNAIETSGEAAPAQPPTPEAPKVKLFNDPTPDELAGGCIITPVHPAAGGYPNEGWPKPSTEPKQ
jgi:hypothetical protein